MSIDNAVILQAKLKRKPLCIFMCLSVMMLSLFLLETPLQAFDSPPVEERREMLQALVEEYADINECDSGRGFARVTYEQDGVEKQRYYVKFMFKDNWTRSELYRVENHVVVRPAESMLVYGKNGSVAYYEPYAYVNLKDSTWVSKLGCNFHPGVYRQYNAIPANLLFQRMLDVNPDRLTVTKAEQGLFDFHHDHWCPEGCSNETQSMPPEHNDQSAQELGAGSGDGELVRKNSRFTKLTWSRGWTSSELGSTWLPPWPYIRYAESITYEGIYVTQEEALEANAIVLEEMKIRVLEFYPMAGIDDSEFELEGLKLPPDTLIYDNETGEEYELSDMEEDSATYQTSINESSE